MRLFALLAACLIAGMAYGNDRFITLASTTSTQNSGLYDHLLPKFFQASGISVRVVAVGTGQALRLAKNGDADVLLVHHRPSEEAFVAEGYGVERFDVMYNDFVLVGPRSDPLELAKVSSIEDAMRKLAKGFFPFISRGDESGTHKKEMELWAAAEIPELGGRWYRSIGAGMGAALNMAAATGSYTLSDRGTWLSFQNKAGLALLYSGDAALRNPYGVIAVNPERHPHTKIEDANTFIDWITSDTGQTAIGEFAIEGQQLFCPNAKNNPQGDSGKLRCPAQ